VVAPSSVNYPCLQWIISSQNDHKNRLVV